MVANNQYQKIVPFIIFVLALLLLFKLILPAITILLSSALLAYITFPLHSKIFRKIPTHKFISIALSLFIVIIVVITPFSFLAFQFTQQGYSFYNSLSSGHVKGALLGFSCVSADSKVCSLLNKAEKFSAEHLSEFGLDKQIEKILLILEDKLSAFILSVPVIFAEIFLTLVISYYIMGDWENILQKAEDLLPMRTKTKRRLVEQFGNIAHTVIYAQLFVALVQGVVGTIGFYLAGVPFALILGVMMAFCALIPAIGTAIIWLPASLFLVLSGYISGDYWVLSKGVCLFLYGILIISTIDNVLLAKIVKAKAKVNQILVIIGVIGGASMFGIMGIFIGPILLPLLVTYFETFKERFN